MSSVAGRSAIVTGGASGIGRAIAARLAADGAHVVVADVDGDAATQTAAAIGATAVALDVRDRDAVCAAVDDVVARHGSIDLLFNNAGVSVGGETHRIPGVHWDRAIEVNIGGVVNGILAAYPRMVEQGTGHIVNTASGAGLAGAVLTAPYSMTKHAVVGLSTSLRPEAARHGVRVTALCPGMVDTPILDASPPEELPPIGGTLLTGRQFLARVGMRPMSAERFAERALRQILRNKAIVVLPASTKALWYLVRMSPGAVERVNRLLSRRVLGPRG